MILADSGFWIGLLNENDRAHVAAVAAAQEYSDETLVSTWPVLGEVCHFLIKHCGSGKAIEFLRDIRTSSCEIYEMPKMALGRIETLMHKYRDLPMDLADASLVVLAEELDEGRILSTDQRDFKAYRWKNTKPFRNLLLSGST